MIPEGRPPEQLSDTQFARIVTFIEREVGIQLPPSKRTMVEGRLRKRVRALGLDTLEAYGQHLFGSNAVKDAELTHLIDCVTTNKTDFFREPAHFDILRDAVPVLLCNRGRGPLKVWSAAASIGAEAYTVAMVLAEMQGERQQFEYIILGTDISTDVIATARAAIYPTAMLDPVPAPLRERYVMTARDARRQQVRIVPELRRQVRFQHLNLMEPSYPIDRDVDVIFCRNVLIYFDKQTQKAVVRKLASHLRPGGYLMLGHSESMAGIQSGLCAVASSVFQASQVRS